MSARVTIHMAASLDGFIARNDGTVDWMETHDDFAEGETLDPLYVAEFLSKIDCYVMGSKTYELAMSFEAKGYGWQYGNKPTFVLTHRDLPRIRDTVQFYAGDVSDLFDNQLKPKFQNIWVVGGGAVAGECLRRGLADEVSYSILSIVIGDGIKFFDRLDADVALHLADVKGYKNGIVELRYEVRTSPRKSRVISQP